jgi:Ca2+-binding EF-hand superfamily protein
MKTRLAPAVAVLALCAGYALADDSALLKESREKYAAEALKLADADKDGRISTQEMHDLRLRALTELRAIEAMPEGDKQAEALNTHNLRYHPVEEFASTADFALADSDDDGVLSRGELGALVDAARNPLEREPDMDFAARQAWRLVLWAFDTNKDGRLDRKELTALFGTGEVARCVDEWTECQSALQGQVPAEGEAAEEERRCRADEALFVTAYKDLARRELERLKAEPGADKGGGKTAATAADKVKFELKAGQVWWVKESFADGRVQYGRWRVSSVSKRYGRASVVVNFYDDELNEIGVMTGLEYIARQTHLQPEESSARGADEPAKFANLRLPGRVVEQKHDQKLTTPAGEFICSVVTFERGQPGQYLRTITWVATTQPDCFPVRTEQYWRAKPEDEWQRLSTAEVISTRPARPKIRK